MTAATTTATRPNKTYHDELAVIREELDKCMKCGNCMAVCPVYGAEKVESAVTRSKIAVAQAVLDGEVVVLLHGFPQRTSSWDAVVPLLHAAGFRTL